MRLILILAQRTLVIPFTLKFGDLREPFADQSIPNKKTGEELKMSTQRDVVTMVTIERKRMVAVAPKKLKN